MHATVTVVGTPSELLLSGSADVEGDMLRKALRVETWSPRVARFPPEETQISDTTLPFPEHVFV